MAILKHIASKNANYGSAIDYLKYQHDEFHLVPVLDESGNMLLREEFYTDCSNNLYAGLSSYLLILFSALSAFAVVG